MYNIYVKYLISSQNTIDAVTHAVQKSDCCAAFRSIAISNFNITATCVMLWHLCDIITPMWVTTPVWCYDTCVMLQHLYDVTTPVQCYNTCVISSVNISISRSSSQLSSSVGRWRCRSCSTDSSFTADTIVIMYITISPLKDLTL